MKRKIESTYFIPGTEPCTFASFWAVEVCADCRGMSNLPEWGHVSDHTSHLIQKVVLIARMPTIKNHNNWIDPPPLNKIRDLQLWASLELF